MVFVMYITGAFIRLYPPKKNLKVYIIAFAASYVLLIASFIGLEYIANKYSSLSYYTTYFRWSNSPIAILASISSFCIAISSRKRNCLMINSFASTVFGIYLFHENVFIKDIIWRILFNCTQVDDPFLIFIKFLCALQFILIIGGLIDVIRKKTDWIIKRPFFRY